MDQSAASIGWMFALGVTLHTIFKWSRWAKVGKASPATWLKETFPDIIGSLCVNVVIVFAYLAGLLPMLVTVIRTAWFPGYSDAIDIPLTMFAAVPIGWLADSLGRGGAALFDWKGKTATAGGGE